MIQSYDKSPYNNRKVKRAKSQQKNASKRSIKQRLRAVLGRSVRVATAS